MSKIYIEDQNGELHEIKDIDEAPELVQSFSRELYDVWQEAKSPTDDNWDDVEYDILSVTHRREYEKTAKRMLAQVSEYLQERMK